MSDRPWLWEHAKDAEAKPRAELGAEDKLAAGAAFRIKDLGATMKIEAEPSVYHGAYKGGATPSEPRADEEQVGGDHYKAMDITPWQVIDTWPKEQRIGAYRAGLLKYTMRLGSKDDCAIEAGKAAHYAKKLLETLEKP